MHCNEIAWSNDYMTFLLVFTFNKLRRHGVASFKFNVKYVYFLFQSIFCTRTFTFIIKNTHLLSDITFIFNR